MGRVDDNLNLVLLIAVRLSYSSRMSMRRHRDDNILSGINGQQVTDQFRLNSFMANV